MASLKGSMAVHLTLVAIALLLSRVSTVEAEAAWALTNWGDAHATFYGGQDASGTMGGACGYGNLYSVGYGTSTAALSYAMFNSGLSCGACYEIVCKLEGSKYCYPGKSITITATNSCPPGSEGGWCDPPKLHFDLSYPMFQKLAQPVGGVIPVKYRRVPCTKSGGVRFTIHGNPYFNYILVHNVGGAGDVAALAIKGSKTDWYYMSQNWGQFWSASANVVGQALSFKVTLGNGKSMVLMNVAPSDWTFGQTFEADQNFY